MPNHSPLGWCKTLAILSVVAGTGGMGLSFLFMVWGGTQDIIAGGAGFIAGAMLFGSGLIALAVLTLTAAWSVRASEVYEDE